MATQRRPLAGWQARPLARKPVRPLAGRPVMITGAASGIGRALAQRLSRAGSAVAIADIDERGLKETETTLAGPSLTRVLDVRDAQAQIDFADRVRGGWMPTPLGAVFNNAGVAVGQPCWMRCRTTTTGFERSTSTASSTAPGPSCRFWSSRTAASS